MDNKLRIFCELYRKAGKEQRTERDNDLDLQITQLRNEYKGNDKGNGSAVIVLDSTYHNRGCAYNTRQPFYR